MIIFDGIEFARQRELQLNEKVSRLHAKGLRPVIVSIVFTEDRGSQLYTQKKKDAANRVGIGFQPIYHSLTDSPTQVLATISRLNHDPAISGVMIQKPTKQVWLDRAGDGEFAEWWRSLVSEIDPNKDVDGLTPSTQLAIKDGSWQVRGLVIPATAQAILLVLDQAGVTKEATVAIIGRSDIVGLPTYHALLNLGYQPNLFGRKDLANKLESNQKLLDFDVVISATGVKHLINGSQINSGVVLIDVGEPAPDIDTKSVEQKARFLSPVPGGVGPVTVVCLLENVVKLVNVKK